GRETDLLDLRAREGYSIATSPAQQFRPAFFERFVILRDPLPDQANPRPKQPHEKGKQGEDAKASADVGEPTWEAAFQQQLDWPGNRDDKDGKGQGEADRPGPLQRHDHQDHAEQHQWPTQDHSGAALLHAYLPISASWIGTHPFRLRRMDWTPDPALFITANRPRNEALKQTGAAPLPPRCRGTPASRCLAALGGHVISDDPAR